MSLLCVLSSRLATCEGRTHSERRSLSERMHVCHCCVLPLTALLFSQSLGLSFYFFLNLYYIYLLQAITVWLLIFIIIYNFFPATTNRITLRCMCTTQSIYVCVCVCVQTTERQCHTLRSWSDFNTQKWHTWLFV